MARSHSLPPPRRDCGTVLRGVHLAGDGFPQLLGSSVVLLYPSWCPGEAVVKKSHCSRIAPWQYEAVEGSHDEAIATSVLKNDINETGYVRA